MSTLPDDFQVLCALLMRNPLQAARKAKKLNLRANELKYQVAAIAYGYAAILNARKEERELFYGDPFWEEGAYKRNPKQILLHALMYIYGSYEGPAGKRAGEHARALQPLFDEGKRFELIPEILKEKGGFRGMACTPIPGGVAPLDEDTARAEAKEAEKPKKAEPAQPKAINGQMKKSVDRPSLKQLLNCLIIELEEDDLKRVLDMPLGESDLIEVTRMPDHDGGWKVFRGTVST